ncbi:UNVERIFIED_CONTAM: hypothetical protein GTU68_052327 [Idotea baltica]|nr:hypothetical protein [Idotea baltica]
MLLEARKRIEQTCGEIKLCSATYITKAWGLEKLPDFHNQVVEIETIWSAQELLTFILEIEGDMGRKRTVKWSSRVIDIDILFYGEEVINTSELLVPHPRISERNFTLVPLMELCSDMNHPVLGVTIEELYLQSEDTLEVLMIEN